MAEKQIFKVMLEKHENTDATIIRMPFDVEKVFDAKRVPVKVRINEAEYRSTIVKTGGNFMIVVPKIFREAANVKAGETIEVSVEKDLEKRTVEVPSDFAEALEKADLKDVFAKMSYTHQKEYVNSIGDAKKEETRRRRIEKSLEMLREKKK
jgi:bifunctional DNA-binding transcriptional regulator/antitoxin component of YhaV-PrlF toxin-antitoxin module